MIRKILLSLCLAAVTATFGMPHAAAQTRTISYDVQKIWDNGSHCAFTSLIRYKGRYYCSFREGATHIFDDKGNAEGKIRILVSKNGKRWEPLPLIGKEGYDLRDPKLSITPDGRLMVIVGGSIYRNRQLVGRIPQVLFSDDGRTFTDPVPVELDAAASSGTDWLWRVTWAGDTGYWHQLRHASRRRCRPVPRLDTRRHTLQPCGDARRRRLPQRDHRTHAPRRAHGDDGTPRHGRHARLLGRERGAVHRLEIHPYGVPRRRPRLPAARRRHHNRRLAHLLHTLGTQDGPLHRQGPTAASARRCCYHRAATRATRGCSSRATPCG